jgi:hypothetical protein
MWPLIRPKARHLVALAVFLPLLLLGLYLVTKNTDAYEEAARFVEQDARVAASIGTVKKTDFKFWEGFEFTGNNANFSVKATSDRGTFVVDVRLRCVAGAWRVEAADIRGQGGTLTRIVAG